MNIKTERLVIRTFEPEDWQDVYAYTSNPSVMKYIPEGVFTEEDARKFVTENSGEHAGKFPVLLKDEKTVIGHIVFFSILAIIRMKSAGCFTRNTRAKDMLQRRRAPCWHSGLTR